MLSLIIPGKELIKLGVVTNLISEEHQVQPAGIELTLRDVEEFEDAGYIDLKNIRRRISKCRKLSFDKEGKIHLKQGAYKVRFNEVISVPENMVGIALPRSSLLRSGASIFSAVWDPGYKGRSESLLVVFNPHGITLERNARLMQIFFVKLSSKPHKVYSGVYQGENVKE
ncbi:MAG: deoxyuridine 5'-triphosphate nucleotidohydrolase [Candidatus Methanomethylicota archaeon]|uniref:Deoxyuridine 5'-triphosphate nucleotidohydrolase n=1 Tax=Thermoproteota archaeon TaxID=2056631 RepID=A0A497F6Q5_9CREN|nr:MAG: deoxyuridine 5'-triphosphate nucleotidohydrolase [Candidatus Verstraetearchaeota archaeon]